MSKEIGGDGNCLFRAFCDQYEGGEFNYKFYRTEACNFMVQNRPNFEPFMEDDEKFDDYIAEMRKDGEWGGNQEIVALATRFCINIAIHSLGSSPYYVYL